MAAVCLKVNITKMRVVLRNPVPCLKSDTEHISSTSTNLRIHSLHFILFHLKLHKVINNMKQFRRDSFEVLVVVILYS